MDDDNNPQPPKPPKLLGLRIWKTAEGGTLFDFCIHIDSAFVLKAAGLTSMSKVGQAGVDLGSKVLLPGPKESIQPMIKGLSSGKVNAFFTNAAVGVGVGAVIGTIDVVRSRDKKDALFRVIPTIGVACIPGLGIVASIIFASCASLASQSLYRWKISSFDLDIDLTPSDLQKKEMQNLMDELRQYPSIVENVCDQPEEIQNLTKTLSDNVQNLQNQLQKWVIKRLTWQKYQKEIERIAREIDTNLRQIVKDSNGLEERTASLISPNNTNDLNILRLQEAFERIASLSVTALAVSVKNALRLLHQSLLK